MSASIESALRERIETVESAYEFMLAYAAQGATGEEEGGAPSEVREQLKRSERALEGLGALARQWAATREASVREAYDAFVDALDRDARSSRAALQVVLAQRAISSQLVDDLNALICLRSLLTGLFLLDEILEHRGS
ncbi:MAG TPA: hypothetical protein VNN77_20135 [candidate division Zixibacteria bacterium]|nr:hypothetical protein [candidate division Zixibacteria bacterium]